MTDIRLEDELKILMNVLPYSLEEVARTSNFVKDHFAERRHETLKILEAGCGQVWWLDLNGLNYELTGVDLSREAVELRQQKFNDLDQVVIGDLLTVEFPNDGFDVIYNSYVLEHVDEAERVLENFYQWLKPGGLFSAQDS